MDLKSWLGLLTSGGVILGGLCFLVWGAISGFRAQRDKAQSGLIEVIKDEAAAWKSRYESEHGEFKEYRTKAHLRDGDMTSKILELTTENAELRAKTDLTPIHAQHKEQTDINKKVVESLDQILKWLRDGNGGKARA